MRGENRSTRRKTSRSRVGNQQQTQPTYGAGSGNRTRDTLVGGERRSPMRQPCSPNRTQFVKIDEIESSMETIACGVPQGSTLGSLLFLLYINDLPNSSEKLSFRIFADDTNIFFTGGNPKEVELTMIEEIKLVLKYCATNKLSVNLKNTNYMLIVHHQRGEVKWVNFHAQTSNTSTRLWFYYIITKIHPPFQNPRSAPERHQLWCIYI